MNEAWQGNTHLSTPTVDKWKFLGLWCRVHCILPFSLNRQKHWTQRYKTLQTDKTIAVTNCCDGAGKLSSDTRMVANGSWTDPRPSAANNLDSILVYEAPLTPAIRTKLSLTLSLPSLINFKFPCSLTRNMTSHSKENLAFYHLRRWKMIMLPILTTSLIHCSLKGWENVLFYLGSERVKQTRSPCINHCVPAEFCLVVLFILFRARERNDRGLHVQHKKLLTKGITQNNKTRSNTEILRFTRLFRHWSIFAIR